LDQPAAGNAAVDLYFIADIDEVTAKLGGRGYRAVQLEAGIRTGQVYLAATALGLRATGLTFYDDEVATFLGLEPAETAVLMLAVFGP
jgi:nitroreductase